MRFEPRRCPRSDCPSVHSGHLRWCFKGYYLRACDGRRVQRFLCLECNRTFSVQSFRLDYRLKKPQLHLALFGFLVSKVTHRQAARILACSRHTIAHLLRLLGAHCRDFHSWRIERASSTRTLLGIFQLDELETYEQSRRLAPVSVPVLIERRSYFVLDLHSAPLPCRGRLSEEERKRKLERERILGKRETGSSAAVARCSRTLAAFHARNTRVVVQTDRKPTYVGILSRQFGERVAHGRYSSKAKRDHRNPLFPINHTFAMMRDGISRLVRRTWAASKLRQRLERHAWIWIVWRNYVRGITNLSPQRTPAMVLGIEERPWNVAEICAWKAPSPG